MKGEEEERPSEKQKLPHQSLPLSKLLLRSCTGKKLAGTGEEGARVSGEGGTD